MVQLASLRSHVLSRDVCTLREGGHNIGGGHCMRFQRHFCGPSVRRFFCQGPVGSEPKPTKSTQTNPQTNKPTNIPRLNKPIINPQLNKNINSHKKSNKLIPLLSAIAAAGATGYYLHTTEYLDQWIGSDKGGGGALGDSGTYLGYGVEISGEGKEKSELIRENSGLIPEKSGLIPEKSGLIPEKSGLIPEKSGLIPEKWGIIPEKWGIIPEKWGLIPEKSGFIPEKSGLFPEKSGLIPEKSGLIPGKSGLIPDRAAVIPEKLSEPHATSPEGSAPRKIEVKKSGINVEKCERNAEKCEVNAEKPDSISGKCEIIGDKCEIGKPAKIGEKCGINSEKCEINSEKCEIHSEKCEINSEKCEINPEKCEINSEKAEIYHGRVEGKIGENGEIEMLKKSVNEMLLILQDIAGQQKISMEDNLEEKTKNELKEKLIELRLIATQNNQVHQQLIAKLVHDKIILANQIQQVQHNHAHSLNSKLKDEREDLKAKFEKQLERQQNKHGAELKAEVKKILEKKQEEYTRLLAEVESRWGEAENRLGAEKEIKYFLKSYSDIVDFASTNPTCASFRKVLENWEKRDGGSAAVWRGLENKGENIIRSEGYLQRKYMTLENDLISSVFSTPSPKGLLAHILSAVAARLYVFNPNPHDLLRASYVHTQGEAAEVELNLARVKSASYHIRRGDLARGVSALEGVDKKGEVLSWAEEAETYLEVQQILSFLKARLAAFASVQP